MRPDGSGGHMAGCGALHLLARFLALTTRTHRICKMNLGLLFHSVAYCLPAYLLPCVFACFASIVSVNAFDWDPLGEDIHSV